MSTYSPTQPYFKPPLCKERLRKVRMTDKSDTTFVSIRNYQVYQQATLIALLNEHFTFKFLKPFKKCHVAEQYLPIQSIEIGDDIIDVTSFIERRLMEKYHEDIKCGIKTSTALRRAEANRITEDLNLLIDLALLIGIQVKSCFSSGRNRAQVLETVIAVIDNGKVLDKTDIITIGKQTNNYLCTKVFEAHPFELQPHNTQISTYFKSI
ncbi:TATA-binding protein-associated phosphoprotein [Entamoeba marina]